MSGSANGGSELPLVAIYADESCLGNGREGENPGGAGVLVEYQKADGEIVRRDVWISEPATTNNRMALRSVIEAFRAIAHKGSRFRVVFTTDSRYIVDGMTQWVHDWARRGWKRKSGPIENLELWQQAVAAVNQLTSKLPGGGEQPRRRARRRGRRARRVGRDVAEYSHGKSVQQHDSKVPCSLCCGNIHITIAIHIAPPFAHWINISIRIAAICIIRNTADRLCACRCW